MKRLTWRLSIVGVVVTLGIIAIVQAQLSATSKSDTAAQDKQQPSSGEAEAPEPIPDDGNEMLGPPPESLAADQFDSPSPDRYAPTGYVSDAGQQDSVPYDPQATTGYTMDANSSEGGIRASIGGYDHEPLDQYNQYSNDQYSNDRSPAEPAYIDAHEPPGDAREGAYLSDAPPVQQMPSSDPYGSPYAADSYAIADDDPSREVVEASAVDDTGDAIGAIYGAAPPAAAGADSYAVRGGGGNAQYLPDPEHAVREFAEDDHGAINGDHAGTEGDHAYTEYDVHQKQQQEMVAGSRGGELAGNGYQLTDDDLANTAELPGVPPSLPGEPYGESLAAATSAVPGDRKLEGARAPSVVIERLAPSEIQVGKPALFQTRIRNVGEVTANRVMVVDQVPRGAVLIEAVPEPASSPDGELLWQLGALEPGEEKTISMELMPQEEGELGSVAQLLFATQAAVRTISTRPELTVEHTVSTGRVLIGETVDLAITISNPGTGPATGVIIEEDVPEGLSHPAGRLLEYEIGTLKPGESRRLELTLNAEQAGMVTNVLRVRGDGNLAAQHELQLEVIAPQLQVAVAGPRRRYLEREAQYSISLSNPGTASAHNVDLVAYLPKGLQFVSADQKGRYDSQQHATRWSLEELPAGETGVVTVSVLPMEAGEQTLRIESRGDLDLQHSAEQIVSIESLAELAFTVADVSNPIEVGSETAYVVRLANTGSKADSNIRLVAQLPDGIEPLDGDGPTAIRVEGQTVSFEPLARLAPNAEAVYRINARGVAAGDHVVRVQVQSDELGTPVTKEESTRVYHDE